MKTHAALLASVLLASSSAVVGAPPSYLMKVLGPNLQGFGMNQAGDVVGRKVLGASLGVAFVARAGASVETLPVPAPWVGSDAYAINNHGLIVGAVSMGGIASIGSRACAWYPTGGGAYTFALLGELPGHLYSTALGVNDLGDIVGGSGGIGLGMYSSSVAWVGGSIIELAGLSVAVDVNNQRKVLAGHTLLDLNTMSATTLPLPPGVWQGVVANELNEVGGFCGHITGWAGCSFPVIHLPGSGWKFVGGCATTTSAVSINDQGDTLTFVYMGGVGVVFHDEPFQAIDPLIAPGQGNWLVTGVSAINNARQILCSGKNLPDTTAQLIVLTPSVFGDLTGDGRVDGADLGVLLGQWGGCAATCSADFDLNGLVDGQDLGALLGAWTG